MKKVPILPYALPILVIIIFLIGIFGCDNVSPDLRKEYINEEIKPDYFGIRFDWKI